MYEDSHPMPPPRLSFGKLLDWFMLRGIRPMGDERQGSPWGVKEFADKVKRSDRQVKNWLQDKHVPEELNSIEAALFGRNQKNYPRFRQILRDCHAAARKNDVASQYAAQSAVEMMWQIVLSELDISDIDYFDCEAKTLSDFKYILPNMRNNIDQRQMEFIIHQSRKAMFDEKYGDWTEEKDERYDVGIELWQREFIFLLNDLKINPERSSMLCVGIGCGLEGVNVYDKFDRFCGIDLSERAVQQAQRVFSRGEIAVEEAEELSGFQNEFDVYISLKTFSSSFFDIDAALISCARALKKGGVAIISIPRGYLREKTLLPGLARTNYNLGTAKEFGTYNIPDKMYPHKMMENIIDNLYRRMFSDIKLYTGLTEHYVCGIKK